VERIGTLGDGGKYVCGLERVAKKPKCVVYSVGMYLLKWCTVPPLTSCAGINGESSFEAAILENTSGCEIWGYDFSVKSVSRHVDRCRKSN